MSEDTDRPDAATVRAAGEVESAEGAHDRLLGAVGPDVADIRPRLLGRAGPLPVWGWDLGRDAAATWPAVRSAHAATGWWPVLVGRPPRPGGTLWFAGADHDPHALAAAEDVDVRDLLHRRQAEVETASEGALVPGWDPRWATGWDDRPDGGEAADPYSGPGAAAEVVPGVPRADLRQVAPRSGLSLLRRRRPVIALVPAAAGADVLALLSWSGAANHDITPAQHTAVLRHWHTRYGAEPVVVTAATVALLVPRPPTTEHEVRSVAMQQYLYCPDVVEQGTGSVDELGRQQVVRRSWSFWWD